MRKEATTAVQNGNESLKYADLKKSATKIHTVWFHLPQILEEEENVL